MHRDDDSAAPFTSAGCSRAARFAPMRALGDGPLHHGSPRAASLKSDRTTTSGCNRDTRASKSPARAAKKNASPVVGG